LNMLYFTNLSIP